MRNRIFPILATLVAFLSLGSGLVALTAGCGGGHGEGNSSGSTRGQGGMKITLTWPEKSRLIPRAARMIEIEAFLEDPRLNPNAPIKKYVLIPQGTTTASLTGLEARPHFLRVTAYPQSVPDVETGTGIPPGYPCASDVPADKCYVPQARYVGQINIVAGRNDTPFEAVLNGTVTQFVVRASRNNTTVDLTNSTSDTAFEALAGESYTLSVEPRTADNKAVLVDESTLVWNGFNNTIVPDKTTGSQIKVTFKAQFSSPVPISVTHNESPAPPAQFFFKAKAGGYGVFDSLGIGGDAIFDADVSKFDGDTRLMAYYARGGVNQVPSNANRRLYYSAADATGLFGESRPNAQGIEDDPGSSYGLVAGSFGPDGSPLPVVYRWDSGNVLTTRYNGQGNTNSYFVFRSFDYGTNGNIIQSVGLAAPTIANKTLFILTTLRGTNSDYRVFRILDAGSSPVVSSIAIPRSVLNPVLATGDPAGNVYVLQGDGVLKKFNGDTGELDTTFGNPQLIDGDTHLSPQTVQLKVAVDGTISFYDSNPGFQGVYRFDKEGLGLISSSTIPDSLPYLRADKSVVDFNYNGKHFTASLKPLKVAIDHNGNVFLYCDTVLSPSTGEWPKNPENEFPADNIDANGTPIGQLDVGKIVRIPSTQ